MPTLASISDPPAAGGSIGSAGMVAVDPAPEPPGRRNGVGNGGGIVMILDSGAEFWARASTLSHKPEAARKSNKGQNQDRGPVRPFRIR